MRCGLKIKTRHLYARSSATAAGPRDALSGEMSCTTIGTNCIRNPQQIEVVELENHS